MPASKDTSDLYIKSILAIDHPSRSGPVPARLGFPQMDTDTPPLSSDDGMGAQQLV